MFVGASSPECRYPNCIYRAGQGLDSLASRVAALCKDLRKSFPIAVVFTTIIWSIPSNAETYLSELNAADPIRVAVKAVGTLEFNGDNIFDYRGKRVHSCPAAVISAKYIITNIECGNIINLKPKGVRAELRLGMDVALVKPGVLHKLQPNSKNIFRVNDQAIVEKNDELNFSILEVFGNPSLRFGTVPLANRDVKENEELLAVLPYDWSVITDCRVLSVPPDTSDRFTYNCGPLVPNRRPMFGDERLVFAKDGYALVGMPRFIRPSQELAFPRSSPYPYVSSVKAFIASPHVATISTLFAGPVNPNPAPAPSLGSTNSTLSELDTRMQYWEMRLPFCTFTGGPPFPAKDQEDGTPCNDGDSVPLNGLTCAAGDERGCVAVHDSQGKNGPFYRSPKKRYEIENNLPTSNEKPSSNDSAQGVWAYIAQKRDVGAFRRWTGWMKEHKELGIWPRYCLDSQCDFNVSDCPMLDRLAVYLGEGNALCNPNPITASLPVTVLQNTFDATVRLIESLPGASLFAAEIDDAKRPITAALDEARKAAEKIDDIREKGETLGRAATHAAEFIAFIGSYANKSGAARQDVAYSIYLLKKYGGLTSPEAANAAEVIADKEPDNAFFEYVAHGNTQDMLSQILGLKDKKGRFRPNRCPSQATDKLWPHLRLQWIWEREDREPDPTKPQPWEQTMYWDCLFAANLYKSGPIRGFNLPALPGYAEASKEAERQLQAAINEVNTLLKTLDELRIKIMQNPTQCLKDPTTCVPDKLPTPKLPPTPDQCAQNLASCLFPSPF